MANSTPKPFSYELENWLKHGKDKTLGGLNNVFAEKTFAILFLLLMALPALPIPTGGLTHVFEVIVALACLQLIVGRKSIWLPKKWLKINAGKVFKGKAGQKLVSIIKWFEKYSQQRWSKLLTYQVVKSLIGIVILVFTVAAFVAPPFSGLDTLPSLGVVVISLALVLEDFLMVLAGVVIGCVGIGIELAAGTALYSGLTHFF